MADGSAPNETLADHLTQQLSELQGRGLLTRCELNDLRQNVGMRVSEARREEIADVVALLGFLGWRSSNVRSSVTIWKGRSVGPTTGICQEALQLLEQSAFSVGRVRCWGEWPEAVQVQVLDNAALDRLGRRRVLIPKGALHRTSHVPYDGPVGDLIVKQWFAYARGWTD